MNINNVFLYGDLREEIYMTHPLGFQVSHKNQIYKLKNSLYGLKQANRQWHFKLTDALKNQGFLQAHADSSLFIKCINSLFITLIIYMDDMILTSDGLSQIQFVKKYLHDEF